MHNSSMPQNGEMAQKGRHIPQIIGWYTTIALNTLHITKSNAMNAHSQKSSPSPPGVTYRDGNQTSAKRIPTLGFVQTSQPSQQKSTNTPSIELGTIDRPINLLLNFRGRLGMNLSKTGAKKLPISLQLSGHFLKLMDLQVQAGPNCSHPIKGELHGHCVNRMPQFDLPQSRGCRKPR